MKCILCCEDKQESRFSDEHVFPDSLGGKLILENMVCRDCNGTYGHSVDSDLVNHELIKLIRLAYQIKGKSGNVPNPLEAGHVVEKEHHKIKYKMSDDGTPEALYTVPSIEKEPLGDGLIISGHVDTCDAGKIEGIIKSICKRQGMVVSEEELKKLRNTEILKSQPEIKIQTSFDLVRYKKGILKISYELACYWLGEKYLNDRTAALIRDALKDERDMSQWKGVHNLKGNIDFIGNHSRIPFWDDKPASHIAFMMQTQGVLIIYVRIFRAFEGIVEVSKTPEAYSVGDGSFIEIDTKLDEMRASTFIEELSSLGQRKV